ncbi:MAG: Holliday junction branch migration protein RuvA [Lachnospiraceae bacterium]|nr:Holliday junction branch migration protein RuvA [Lachnospiraceae bacterium]MBP5276221.1 Holliday junction branch migration protein RuvA [Lachnospiraceae bacterium]MBP5564553.1 Holliday junction branch migration protein RuvA [Lachnospiraceae bacterium]
MYGFVRGTIEYIKNNQVCIDTGNVGYLVNISEKTYSELLGETDEVKLYTYTSVKEDDISLFGFLTLEELDFFKLLIGVNSIGPKLGMSVLSFFTIPELVAYINAKDAKSISKAPGLGAKSAEKIIIDLKDKVASFESADIEVNISSNEDDETVKECIDALMSLGFKKKDAQSAVRKVKDYSDLSDLLSKALVYFDN